MRKLDLNESASITGGVNCGRIWRRVVRQGAEMRANGGRSRVYLSTLDRWMDKCFS